MKEKVKKVRTVMQSLGNQVQPAVGQEMGDSKTGQRLVPPDRRQNVADLYYKRFTVPEIAEKLNLTIKQVSKDLKVIRSLTERQLIRSIEFHRKEARHRLDAVLKAGWELHANTKLDAVKASALRVIISEEELRAKVDGVIAEKIPPTAEKKSDELLKRLATIAKGKDGNGQKDVEVTEVATAD